MYISLMELYIYQIKQRIYYVGCINDNNQNKSRGDKLRNHNKVKN